MSLLGQRPVLRRRFADGTYNVSGEYVSGAPTTTTIQASVQELSFKEMQQLEEGERAMDPIVLLTKVADWRTSEADGVTEADQVDVDGFTYRVLKVASRHSLIAHFQVTALKLREAG